MTKQETMKTPRKRDVVWDALVLEFGEPTNDIERGRRNKACKMLRQSRTTPLQVQQCMTVYRAHPNWRTLTRTPLGLAGNVSELLRLFGAGVQGRLAPPEGKYDD